MLKAIVAACALFALPASAEGAFRSQKPIWCGTTKDVTSELENDHGQRMVMQGQGPGGVIVQVFISPEGSLAVMDTLPNGLSCLVAVGKDVEVMEDPKRIMPNPASFTEL